VPVQWCSLPFYLTPRLHNKQFSSVFTVSTDCSAINNYSTKYKHCQLWQLDFSIHCQLMALSTTTKNDSFITVDYFWRLLLHALCYCLWMLLRIICRMGREYQQNYSHKPL